ncbi:MICOS complex subunit mic60 [Phytophthora citrophthora]|uniref:MICOS complex subunit mic60 n=1 Tax=Phytophthora citrophthora TaxID=4793 RepID=A0AAD9GS90_9STRA|nr:MICOS complex subunit mic60 [Phytophthora citrophthora]
MIWMLRQVSRTRAAMRAVAGQSRTFSVPPKAPAAPKVVPPVVGKPPTSNKPVPPPSAPKSAPAAAAADSSTGSSLPKLLLLGLLSAPAATAVYVKQNPEWNPAVLKDDARWIKFRELVLGKDASKEVTKKAKETSKEVTKKAKEVAKTSKEAVKEVVAAPVTRSPEDFSDAINKGQKEVKKEEKAKKKAEKKAEKKEEKKAEKKNEKKNEKVEKELEKAEKKAEKAEKKVEKAEKKVAKLKKEVEVKSAVEKVEDKVHKVEKEVKKDVKKVAAAAAGAATAVEKKVHAATAKAREEISKLAGEASPEHLGHQMDKQIQATTNELLNSLKAESDAAAAEMDRQYLSGLNELDANALTIRVAQLATEMKHRSKWEAVRLLESLRHMEEDAQKKSMEVLRRQDELHKELLARELRLQQELLSRQSREEMNTLKKQYTDDLARNVSQQRASLLSGLQRTFARESKAIEERYAQQMKEATEKMQKTLADEREKRVQELENYRAELRALGTVLDSSSTYEAFSHRVHKASMAALALSDRVEAAAPLRSEIRALREAARNDPFIEVAVKSLPQEVIEQGAPSVGQLQERFKVVKSVGHRAALVPENSGIIGQAFGTALSLLMIPPGGPVEGTDTDAVLSRAEFALKAGDIEKAIVEMKGLSGLPAQVSQDWIAAAESRLAVEQTAKVVKAHVALLAASCS